MRSKLILGTVQFGLPYGIKNQVGLPPEDKVFEILDRASKLGIKTLDTAAAYGEAEERIGSFHEKSEKRFKIISKFSNSPADGLDLSLRTSLKKLKSERLEIIMFHSFGAYRQNKNKDNILRLRNELYGKLGVSVYTNSELIALENEKEVDVIQLPFNLLDNEQQRGRILYNLKKAGKEVHTRSCFLQGLFFMDERKLPQNLESLRPYLEEIKNLAKVYKLEIGHLAMQYVIKKEYIDAVLFGVDSVKQLEQNIIWSEKSIPETVFDQIDQIKVKNTHLLNPSLWEI